MGMGYCAKFFEDFTGTDEQDEYFNSIYQFNAKSLIGTDVDKFANKIEDIHTDCYFAGVDKDNSISESFYDEDEANDYCNDNDLLECMVWEVEVFVNTPLTKDELEVLNKILNKRMKTENISFESWQ